MFQYIPSEDWTEFEEMFPEAAAFLRRRSLVGELMQLRYEAKMHPSLMQEWKTKRLAELEKWAEDTLKTGGTL